MDAERLVQLLEQVRSGKLAVPSALAQLRHLPFEDLGFAKIDHHRALRQGFPEVIMGQGKQTKDIVAIVAAMRQHGSNILVTRVDAKKYRSSNGCASGSSFTPARAPRHGLANRSRLPARALCWWFVPALLTFRSRKKQHSRRR